MSERRRICNYYQANWSLGSVRKLAKPSQVNQSLCDVLVVVVVVDTQEFPSGFKIIIHHTVSSIQYLISNISIR